MTRKRRIVLNGKFMRAGMTGVHRVAIEHCNALAELVAEGHPAVAGLDLVLAVPAEAEAAARRAVRLPVTVLRPLGSIPWEQLTLPLLRPRGTLLVSLCNIGPMLAGNAITMFHDMQVRQTPASYRPAFRYWYNMVQPILSWRNRAILTVSAFSRDEIVKAGLARADKVHVIHNGVDHILRVAAEPIAVAGRDPARPYVVALATTQAHKNIRILLEAFAREELRDIDLVLIGGDGADRFRAVGLGVPANVHFAGRVSDGELRALMEGALCLAFPSTTEGFGLPPLEAMLLGCPAVVAPCGALPEVVGEAGLYANPDDAGEWAVRILALAESPQQRAALVEAGRERAGMMTWRNAAQQLAELLHRA